MEGKLICGPDAIQYEEKLNMEIIALTFTLFCISKLFEVFHMWS